MSRRRSPQRVRIGSQTRVGLLGLGLLALAGCNDRNRGIMPDGAGLYFPAGTVLDPRVAEDTPARWMFVLNANSDLVFNAGSVVPVDIEAFFEAWMRSPEDCFRMKDVDGDGIKETEDGDAEACQPGRPPGKAQGDGAWTQWPEVADVGAELARLAHGIHDLAQNLLVGQVVPRPGVAGALDLLPTESV